MVSAGNPTLFKAGEGCGACYQVRCNTVAPCSGLPVAVTITDECPGGPCLADPVHFDMSGKAFGSMALPGKENELRSVGAVEAGYRRTPCFYAGFNLTFVVDEGSNPSYFATVIMYVEGEGELEAVDLKQSDAAGDWLPMQRSFGAEWKLNSGTGLTGPFSLRLTSPSAETIVAADVIPADWKPGATYQSPVNFANNSPASLVLVQ